MMYNKDAIKIMKAGVKMTEKKRFVPLIIAGCVLVLLLSVFAGCGNNEESYLKNEDEVIEDAVKMTHSRGMGMVDFAGYMTYDDMTMAVSVGSSCSGVVAECIGSQEFEYITVYKFQLVEHIYGKELENEFEVAFPNYIDIEIKTGHRYLILPNEGAYVNMELHKDIYESSFDFIIDVTTLNASYCHALDIEINEEASAQDVVTFIKMMADDHGYLKYDE